MSKVAIITGSSRGIGASCAVEFAKKGYKLALQGRDVAKLNEIKAKCSLNGSPGVLTVAMDLSETEKLETLIQKTVTEFGRIDVLGQAFKGDFPVQDHSETVPLFDALERKNLT